MVTAQQKNETKYPRLQIVEALGKYILTFYYVSLVRYYPQFKLLFADVFIVYQSFDGP